MQKSEIIQLINAKHDILFEWLDAHGDKYWNYNLPGKWTTGQIILHLIQSERPLNKALRMPKFLLKYKFGKPNRPARKYDEVVNKYKSKLDLAGEVVSPFSSKMVNTDGKMDSYVKMLKDEHQRLMSVLDRKWSDETLIKCLVPHPLMGKMHIKEIMMWTAFHTEHHYLQIKERAEASKLV